MPSTEASYISRIHWLRERVSGAEEATNVFAYRLLRSLAPQMSHCFNKYSYNESPRAPSVMVLSINCPVFCRQSST